ncbi:WD-repeat protein [Aspergillus neoniger CBS 115656]|uniref:WD-repeat protein n=1 Tax=Aspergillus neoniger (strain CBS 115656) TaxID=1448310 RepID=A0A318YCV7_ASPNB|nr:WD-repeat protein [Aspergillus neoniger CBS 115656]PYH31834.1 WD-repeat protein [Aspergillus neoniger CBS 115656]
MLDDEHADLPRDEYDPNTYVLGSLSGHNVVLASLPKGAQGTASTAAVAIHLARTFPAIELRLLVGVGGGIPSKNNDIRLGDVAVSAPDGILGGVVEYDLGKETTSGFKRKGISCPPPTEWRGVMTMMQSDHRVRSNRIAEFLSDVLRNHPELREYHRPSSETDTLFTADYIHAQAGSSCASCDKARAVQRRPRVPSDESRVFYGIIASGNRMISDGRKRDVMATEYGGGGAICCETGAAGLMDQFPCIVFRGISHYCDSHQDDGWHAYAAGAAAALAKEALAYMEPLDTPPREEHTSEWKANVLKQLYTCNYRDAKDRNPQRVEGTCQWFIQHHLFENWREDHGSSLLWVSADPGCGKSVLARYLLDEVLLSSETSVVCYFFFKEDFEDRKSLVDALCCILHQIFEQKPRLLSDRLRSRFESETGHIYQSVWSLWSILCDLAGELPAGQVICVLDAVDECGCDGQSQLAECLTNLYQNTTASSKLIFLVTSRPYSAIQRGFQSLENNFPAIHLRGEDNDEVQKIAGEINMVIEHRVEELAGRLQLLADERNLLLSELTSVQNRTYLWIDHIMSTLDDILTVTPTSIHAAIRRLPRTLDEAYNQILRRTPDPDRAMKILHIVVAANTPLTVADMATAVAVLDRKSPEDQLEIEPEHRKKRSIREICGLFITIIDSRINLLHETARDFLVYREGKSEPIPDLTWKASLNPHDSEWTLAKACVGFLHSMDPKMASKDQRDLVVEFNRTPFLEYAVKNWSKHVLSSGIEEDQSTHSQIMDIIRRGEAFCLWFNNDTAAIHQLTPSTTLMRASWLGLRRTVQTLLQDKDIDLNYRSTYGRSALSLAAEYGTFDVLELLLRQSWSFPFLFRTTRWIDVNEVDNSGLSPLAHAAYHGNESIVSLLLSKRGIRPDMRTFSGRKTPFGYAAGRGHLNITKMLLATGKVDPDAVDYAGLTPIVYAADAQHDDVVTFLLNTGRVDPNRKGIRGMTVLSRAAHRGHGIKDLNSRDKGHENIVKSLLSTGIPDPNCRDAGGKTPLAQASYYGHDEIVGLLLENDEVNPDIQDDHGRTPLALACQGGHESIVALLLKTGRVNPNSEDHYGTKLLTPATECGNEGIIKLISDAINSRDSENAAPEFQPAIDASMIWPRNILYLRWPQNQTVIPYKGSWLSR